MKNTIIFDLDGTLLNTLDDLMDSTNFALTQMGFAARNYDEVRAFVGEGVRLLIQRALPDSSKDKVEETLKIFQAHYNKNKNNKTRPYKGIENMLDDVSAAGYKTAIVSNKYDAAVQELKNARFPQIDLAIGEKTGLNKKPAPDAVFEALKLLGSDPSEAVYVGDSDIDVKTARNAGLPIVAVTWGFRDRELLQSLKADAIVSSPDELLNAVRKL